MSKIKHKRRTSKKSQPMAFSSDSPSVDSFRTVDMVLGGGSNSQQFSDVSTAETGNIPRYLNTLSHNTYVSPGHSGQTTSESISTRKRKRNENDSGRRDSPKYRRHRKQPTGADRDNVATKTEKNSANTEDSKVTGETQEMTTTNAAIKTGARPDTHSRFLYTRIHLKTEYVTIKEEPRADPDYSSSGESEKTQQHGTRKSSRQSESRSNLQSVNTSGKREPRSDPHYSSTEEPDSTNRHWNEETFRQPETSSKPQSVKLEPSTVNTTMKLEPMSDNLCSSTGIHDENGAVGFFEQARTSLQQQNGQDAISGSTDDDDDEREFQQFRLRRARRIAAKHHLKDTCSDIENYEFCTNVKAYLNNILENLPPEEYEKTALMTEDPFFNERMDRIMDEPFLTTLFAMLHHQGVITRQDICCITHPLSSGSAKVFNLVEVLKRKPNGRKAFETAAQDCLQEELLHEELFDMARFSQSPTLYFGDLPKLEQYFAHKYSSEMENWKEKKYSLLHNAAAEGNFTLYKQLEMFFLLLKDDQEKHLYIQRHRDAQKNTILHVAVECGNDEVCGYLCSQYPFLTRCRNVMNQEPIHLAIANNKTNTKCLKHLMESNGSTYPQVDSVINGVAAQNIQRLLVLAYTRDNVEAVKYIFTKYPSLKSQKGFQGRMPIHSAAACGGLECFKYIEHLLVTGIDSEHKYTVMKELTENNCSNILHIACESGSIDIISYIIQRYPQLLHIKGHGGREPIHYAVQMQGLLQSFVNVFDALNENKTKAQKLDYLIKARDRNEDTVLHLACLLGRMDIVKYLLTTYPSLIVVRGSMGNQPLQHAASKDGSIECFKFILDTLFRNKTVNDQLDYLKIATNYQNDTVLHLACLGERKDVVEYLLKKYPSLFDLKGYIGRQQLHTPAYKDVTFECFKYILDIVLDKTVEDPVEYLTKTMDDESDTVLHVACLCGRKDIVEYLLTKYPSLVDVKGYIGRHLLHTAADKTGTFECFKYILDIVLDKTVEDPVEYLTTTRNDESDTVLHVACLCGRKDIVEYLLTKYPSLVDVKGYIGRHLLHTAADKTGTFECFKYILDIVLDKTVEDPVEYFMKTMDDESDTVLHVACFFGRKDIVEYLLTKYPSLVDVKGYIGRQLLHTVANKTGTFECFKYILDIVLDKTVEDPVEYLTKTRDDQSNTVLHVACLCGRKDIVEYLLTKYPSLVDVKGFRGKQPLLTAASTYGTFDCFRYILDNVLKSKCIGEQVDYLTKTKDDQRNTVLHVACLYGRKDIAEYLLTKYPSLIDVKGFNGKQPLLSAASTYGTFDCFRYVLDTGLKSKYVEDQGGYLTRTRDESNNTVLHIACLYGRTYIVEYLLTKYRSRFEVKGFIESQLLHTAANKTGTFECFKYILDIVLDKTVEDPVEYLTTTRNDESDTVLNVACLCGRKDIVEYLLTKYPSLVDVIGYIGRHLLHTAA